MEQIHIDTLNKFRHNIIADVYISNGIINPLLVEHILKPEDVEIILNGKTREEKTSKLLDILPRCGPYAFEEFNNVLKHHYNWLSVDMERHLESFGTTNLNPFYFDDLPPCPTFTVKRKELRTKLKQFLQQLRPTEYLAVHGLRGIGKSCITRMALKEKHLVAELFQNEIYWMKFNYDYLESGNIEDEILIQLNFLHQKITKSVALAPRLQSETIRQSLTRFIELHFKQSKHKNALLILDDVTHRGIVDAFDFGCKTLVITDDLTVVKHKRPLSFEISNGFTEDESLNLFAKFFDITVDLLPQQVKKIHKQCNGLPLLINMIAARLEDFKEELIEDPTRLQKYLTILEEGDPKNSINAIASNTFNMCIEKLSFEEKEYYYELVIFKNDVNVSPKTLEILWNMEAYNVNEFMINNICPKSLATRKWNNKLKSYVYGIHNLLLNHLRITLGPELLKTKHRSFIEKYERQCDKDFSQLPVDNYIHSYLGHHLEKAELYEQFEKIYLNLKFIQVKIINAGLNDLLIDLQKYRRFITLKHTENKLKLHNLEQFLKDNISILTEHRTRNCLDIIQIALCYGKEGFVLDEAQKLANEKPDEFYLSRIKVLEHEKPYFYVPEKITFSFFEPICTLCFIDEQDYILLATKSGHIVKRNVKTGVSTYFYGLQHEIIKKLLVSHSGKEFLALSEKGISKLFRLEESEANGEKDEESPREKQTFYTEFFNKMEQKDESLQTFCAKDKTISDVAFSNNDELIAGCTEEGSIHLWNKTGEELHNIQLSNISLKKIIFSTDLHRNTHLFLFHNDCAFTMYKVVDKNSLDYFTTYNTDLNNVNANQKIIFFRKLRRSNFLIIVKENKAFLINWEASEDLVHSFNFKANISIDDCSKFVVSATITYDEKYLIIARSDGYIEIRDIRNEFALLSKFKGNISSLDTYWVQDENYHLICGKENSLIHRWKLKEFEEPKALSEPLFSALMKPVDQNDMVLRQINKKIIINQGNLTSWNKITEMDFEGNMKNAIFSKDNKKVIYDVIKNKKQEIYLYDVNKGSVDRIIELTEVSNFVKIVSNFETNDFCVIVQEKTALKVWHDHHLERIIYYAVPNVGNVIDIHEMDKNEFITVTKKFIISYWNVYGSDWQLLFQDDSINNLTAIGSTMSGDKSYLAVLSNNKKMILLYNVEKSFELNPIQVRIDVYHKISQLQDEVSCFKFSNNEKYLAIGFNNGHIDIFDIEEKNNIYMFNLHLKCVKQLFWKSNSKTLLSVSSEEAALWTVVPKKVQRVEKINRRGETKNVELVESFNQKNMVKKDKLPLLRIIPLSGCITKLCVSDDFEKFLTIESNTGFINIFTPLKNGPTQRSRCSMI